MVGYGWVLVINRLIIARGADIASSQDFSNILKKETRAWSCNTVFLGTQNLQSDPRSSPGIYEIDTKSAMMSSESFLDSLKPSFSNLGDARGA